ncbi:MAG: D-alanyl-D-alanine carboxypeptidase [Oscillospiraceae bacterium]|nr:D-alanyl-D-alanine carboxypeptidase [Oscillospiraceae bacterium]
MRKQLCSVLLSAVLLFCSLPMPHAAAMEITAVSAKACVVMEATTREVFFAQNETEQLPMASTTKIMTTLLCLESGDLDTPFRVDDNAIQVEGSSMGLVKGDIVTKRALCYGMMLPSGNDAAGATAVKLAGSYEAFAEQMNQRAEQIGLQNTHFVTPSGLHDEQHYSTAYDMAMLTAVALQNADFREICGQTTAKVSFGNPPYERWLKNTNKLLTQCEGVIGVKTGFTDEAGRCLVSACTRNDITLICVTLNDPNDWQTHSNLYDAIFPTLQTKTVSLPENLQIPVVGGTAEQVALQTEGTVTYGSNGTVCDIQFSVRTKPFLFAPVLPEQYGGVLVAEQNGRELFRLPLVTKESVSEKETVTMEKKEKLHSRLWNWFRAWFQKK